MPRYIDADLLIETMQKRYDEICDAYGYRDLYASGYDDAVDAVENSPTFDVSPKSAWISVDERLPDPGLPILIFTRKNRYYVGYYYKAVVDTTYTGFYADSVKRDVTHWMPMPEPPITDKPTQE